ncbi:MAG: helix-turn-helix domain-containing protein [Gammaproteobacteria bacterium]
MESSSPTMGKALTLEAAFGNALRELRHQAGYSQEGLAFESSLDRTYISLLERGLRQPSLTTIFVLADVLGIAPSKMIAKVEDTKIAIRR